MRPYDHPLQNRPPDAKPRDGNSAGGLGSLDFELQRTLPDIDFPPPRPPLSSLHFGPRPLLSLSFSRTLNTVDFAVLLALIAPQSLLSFRFARPFVPPFPLFRSFSSSSPVRRASARPSGDQFGATEQNVSRPGEIYSATQRSYAHAHASSCSLHVQRSVFNFPQGGPGIIRLRILYFCIMKSYSISGGWTLVFLMSNLPPQNR